MSAGNAAGRLADGRAVQRHFRELLCRLDQLGHSLGGGQTLNLSRAQLVQILRLKTHDRSRADRPARRGDLASPQDQRTGFWAGALLRRRSARGGGNAVGPGRIDDLRGCLCAGTGHWPFAGVAGGAVDPVSVRMGRAG